MVIGIDIAQFKGNGVSAMRSIIINKILSFQYRLGKLVGRRRAGYICIFVERTFTNIFGREVYGGGKWRIDAMFNGPWSMVPTRLCHKESWRKRYYILSPGGTWVRNPQIDFVRNNKFIQLREDKGFAVRIPSIPPEWEHGGTISSRLPRMIFKFHRFPHPSFLLVQIPNNQSLELGPLRFWKCLLVLFLLIHIEWEEMRKTLTVNGFLEKRLFHRLASIPNTERYLGFLILPTFPFWSKIQHFLFRIYGIHSIYLLRCHG